MVIERRSFLTAGASALAGGGLIGPAAAAAPGLKPGGADQSAAFAKAVAAAAASGRPLQLEAGAYRVGGVAVPPGTRIEGIPGATRLVAIGPGPILRAEGGGDLALAGLTLDGGNAGMDKEQGLVMLSGLAAVDIRDCRFRATPGHALVLQRCGGLVETCAFEAVQTAIYANDSAGLAIRGNRVRGCGDNGILVHRSEKGYDGTLVVHNRIESIRADGGGLGWNGNGINVYRAGHVVVAQNVLRDCAFSFIRANSADAVEILGNSCDSAGETGIYSEFAFEGAVIAQNVVERAANGISVVNFDKGGRLATVQGNIVRSAFRRILPEGGRESYGSGIAIEADATATGNVVENCPTAGFSLGYGNYLRDVVLSGNVARQCGVGVAITVADAARGALVTGNVFSGCPGGAVVGYAWEDKATGDLTAEGTGAYPGIVVTGNSVR
ncbi:TIGR03808 family TAT-translocated repetitive protein [Labrys wisconsinensis]|uniref:Secreted repeat protein (TIGR03808 family) n=1 Tax=Labrys wisconsinensis TaxID=425677 RepID=A0ABU0J601_9HYPH|nr:TIGR03808 family TAT-translocated repetitive protein [Labrys wisconsinensis]MDQ0469683.1 putative secreted repeat protein (TIGR03808 family) [Labrys wisconsinensis]